MYNIMVREKGRKNFYKEDTGLYLLKEDNSLAKFVISYKMVNAVGYDLGRLSTLMIKSIMEGLINDER